jgi:hypothetical protein
MSRFHHPNALAGRGVAVAGDHHAFQRPLPRFLERRRHLRGALARPDHDRPALGSFRQMLADRQFRVGGRDGGVEDGG